MSFIDKMKELSLETKAKQREERAREKEKRVDMFGKQLASIVDTLERDIESDARERAYGFVSYHLKDENDNNLMLDEYDDLSPENLCQTEGYSVLAARCKELGLKVKIVRSCDERESEKLGWAIYSITITVSGWS